MTRDDIICMAREAGFSAKHTDVYFDRQLERFARAAYEAGAASEREAHVRHLEFQCDKMSDYNDVQWLRETIAHVRANAAARARGRAKMEPESGSHTGECSGPRHQRAETEDEPTRSQKMTAAGFTTRDTRLKCDECGLLFTQLLLPIHKCTAHRSNTDDSS